MNVSMDAQELPTQPELPPTLQDFIVNYVKENGHSPSGREVVDFVMWLQATELIMRDPGAFEEDLANTMDPL